MIANSSIKSLDSCDIVKYWANIIEVRRILKKEDDLYIDDLYLLACVYRLRLIKGKDINRNELAKPFNIIAARRLAMVDKLLSRGFIVNSAEGLKNRNGRVFKLSVTPLGEQLLNKYRKFLLKLVEG